MASRVRPINLLNFTGGLNLRADAFELGPTESPDMLNVDLDPRGGFVARKGWTRWNTASIATPWDPRFMFVHELSSGTDRVYVTNEDRILYSTDGVTWTEMQAAATDVVAQASPHLADFAAWGDTVYIACGTANQMVQVSSTPTATRLTQAEAATFTAYASPSNNVGPHCELVASHGGYLFAAGIEEDGTTRLARLRWSHPNNPVAWHADDYYDINETGGPITGLVPMGDHLLIFKPSSVYALFGYDSDSWQLVNVTKDTGAVHRQAITRNESTCFYYSHGIGVFAISDGNKPVEISEALRPAIEADDFANAYSDNIWLGWVHRRLYFSVPYSVNEAVTDATTMFVWDPSIGDGAWMAWRGSDGYALGPFGHGGFSGGTQMNLGCARSAGFVMKLNDNDSPLDDFDGTPTGFTSYYVTRWVEMGYPTLKKSWRRPDYIMKERSTAYTVTVNSYRDYDEANVARSKTVSVPAGATGGIWGAFNWGDGTLWGAAAKGSVIVRGSNLGPSRSVQLKFTGQVGKAWGVDAIVFKVIPRRMR